MYPYDLLLPGRQGGGSFVLPVERERRHGSQRSGAGEWSEVLRPDGQVEAFDSAAEAFVDGDELAVE